MLRSPPERRWSAWRRHVGLPMRVPARAATCKPARKGLEGEGPVKVVAPLICRLSLLWKFSDTRITTPDGSEVPAWTLGLAGPGVLPHFQGAVGTGFEMTSYHCKFLMGMGEWDAVDILPASMSGEPGQFAPQLTQP